MLKDIQKEIPLEVMFPFMKKATKPKRDMSRFKKPTNKVTKDEQVMANTILVVANLMLDYIDHFMDMEIPLKDLPEHPLNQAIKFCEEFGDRIAYLDSVKGTNYLENLGRKVHFLIEQNYRPLQTLENKVYKKYTK